MPKIELAPTQPQNPGKPASFYANSASKLHHGRVSAEGDLRSMPPAIKTYSQAESSDPLLNQRKRDNSIPAVKTSLKLTPRRSGDSSEKMEVVKKQDLPAPKPVVARPKSVGRSVEFISRPKPRPVRQVTPQIDMPKQSVERISQPIDIPKRPTERALQSIDMPKYPAERASRPAPANRPRMNSRMDSDFAAGSAARVAAMNARLKQKQQEKQEERLKSASPSRTRYDSQTGYTYSENYRPVKQKKAAPVGQKSPYFLDSVDVDKRPLHGEKPIKKSAKPKTEKVEAEPAPIHEEKNRFITKNIEKKPLGKVSKKPDSAEVVKPERKIVRANSYDTKVVQPETSSKVPMALLVVGTVILGAIVGFVLFLAMF